MQLKKQKFNCIHSCGGGHCSHAQFLKELSSSPRALQVTWASTPFLQNAALAAGSAVEIALSIGGECRMCDVLDLGVMKEERGAMTLWWKGLAQAFLLSTRICRCTLDHHEVRLAWKALRRGAKLFEGGGILGYTTLELKFESPREWLQVGLVALREMSEMEYSYAYRHLVEMLGCLVGLSSLRVFAWCAEDTVPRRILSLAVEDVLTFAGDERPPRSHHRQPRSIK